MIIGINMTTNQNQRKEWIIRIVANATADNIMAFEETLVGYMGVDFYRAEATESKASGIKALFGDSSLIDKPKLTAAEKQKLKDAAYAEYEKIQRAAYAEYDKIESPAKEAYIKRLKDIAKM